LKTGRVGDSLAAFQQAIDLYEAKQSPAAEQLRQGLKDLGLENS
jgi:hypothetical protein